MGHTLFIDSCSGSRSLGFLAAGVACVGSVVAAGVVSVVAASVGAVVAVITGGAGAVVAAGVGAGVGSGSISRMRCRTSFHNGTLTAEPVPGVWLPEPVPVAAGAGAGESLLESQWRATDPDGFTIANWRSCGRCACHLLLEPKWLRPAKIRQKSCPNSGVPHTRFHEFGEGSLRILGSGATVKRNPLSGGLKSIAEAQGFDLKWHQGTPRTGSGSAGSGRSR